MNALMRWTGLLAAAVVLAGCGDEPVSTDRSPLPAAELATLEVTPQSAPRERSWDGVVEAVNQATLSAQTGGRVIELPFDVNDFVEAGEVVVRFTDVEQQLVRALSWLKARTATRRGLIATLLHALATGHGGDPDALERMALTSPEGIKPRIEARLLALALNSTRVDHQ